MSGDPALRDAVAARLLAHAAHGLGRLNVELEREQVTLWTRAGRLCASCTCGDHECAHFWAVLALLDEGQHGGAVEARARSSSRPPPMRSDLDALSDAIDELSLSTARAGLSNAGSPSITQAIDQLLAAAPDPLPLPLARWLGRLRGALEISDVATCARLLHGALGWADELRSGSEEARGWLGDRTGIAQPVLADASLLEVAREWLDGLDRASIERRYLIDLTSGELYAEERQRGALDCSVGPCPRSAHVSFAELDPSARPRRVRLLQYTLSLALADGTWPRVLELATGDIASLRTRFVEELAAAPALAEPFALLAPVMLEAGPAGALRDARDERLALFDERGNDESSALRAAIAGADLACVLGRLHAGDAGLTLRPLSAIVRRGAWYELRRVT